ncbi:hypothetical protein D5086_010161 [Populus alba]|uniref:Uncharacterized protein n=1 Tax=Populus alba TaxID=43335 RepID=A0ACC4C984_POPAL
MFAAAWADIQPDYKLKAGNIVCSLGRGEDGQLGHGYGCLPDSWGRNQNGQLGLGTTEGSLVPKKIQGFQALRYQVAGDSPWHWLLMENFMAWDGISDSDSLLSCRQRHIESVYLNLDMQISGLPLETDNLQKFV